jgi:HSP20 family protein
MEKRSMAKIPKESIEKLMQFHDEIGRAFKNIFELQKDQQKVYDNINFPFAVDDFEVDDAICVEAEIPGVDKGDIELPVLRDALVIKGIKNKEKSGRKQCNYYCIERGYGKFNRVVELPACANTSKINATLKEGILTITLPKIEDRRGRIRKINIKGD